VASVTVATVTVATVTVATVTVATVTVATVTVATVTVATGTRLAWPCVRLTMCHRNTLFELTNFENFLPPPTQGGAVDSVR